MEKKQRDRLIHITRGEAFRTTLIGISFAIGFYLPGITGTIICFLAGMVASDQYFLIRNRINKERLKR